MGAVVIPLWVAIVACFLSGIAGYFVACLMVIARQTDEADIRMAIHKNALRMNAGITSPYLVNPLLGKKVSR